MAKVPTYDQPQVDAAALRAPALGTVASPELLGAEAQKQADLSKAMIAGGTGGVAVGMLMQERENADMVLRAETSIKDGYIAYESDTQEKRQGRNAVGVTKDTEKWWGEQIKAHGEKLGNDEQRRQFEARLTATRQASIHGFSKFEAVHREKSWLDGEQASTNATIGIAVGNPNPETIANAGAAILGATQRIGDRKGWDDATLQAKRKELFTGMHHEIFNGLLLKDYSGAKAYFEQAKKAGQIDETKYDTFEKQLREGGKDTLAQNWGDKAIASGWTLEKAIEEARKDLNGPEEEHVVAKLEHRYARQDSITLGKINIAILGGASILQVQQMPEFLKLGPEKQAAALKTVRNEQLHNEQLAATRESRAASRESRAYTAEQRAEVQRTRDMWGAYNDYSDPAKLAGMKRDEIANLLPVLGAQHTHNLLTKFDSFEKSGAKIIEARIDQDDFNHVAQGAGLKPFDPKKSEDEKAALGELKYKIENIIDQEQTKLKKQLTREQKMQIFQREIDNKVITDGWIRDTPKSSILLSPDEQKNAYVTVAGEKIKVSSIPAADRAEIIRARSARGLAVSEQAIAETWIKAKAAKPKKAGTTDPALAVPM